MTTRKPGGGHVATKSLTYAELAEVWGVSKEAARKKVEALHLPRQLGNDGKARVMIDLEKVQHEPQKPKPAGRIPPGDRPETARRNRSPDTFIGWSPPWRRRFPASPR